MTKKTSPRNAKSDAALIDEKIKKLGDWRGALLARLRRIIKAADPDVIEEVKWRKPSNPLGVALWSHDGMIATGETYKAAVKLTFAYGASLADPAHLFNASLDGGTRRAIDFHEGDTVNERALTTLIREAVDFNIFKAEERGERKQLAAPTSRKASTKKRPRKKRR